VKLILEHNLLIQISIFWAIVTIIINLWSYELFYLKVIYISGSQPFGLQVPVKDKVLSYCPGQKFKGIVSQSYLFHGPKNTK